jgi:hypothetical protein
VASIPVIGLVGTYAFLVIKICYINRPSPHLAGQYKSILQPRVRSFGAEPGYKSGSRFSRLPKIGFVESSDHYAFGFLDPAHVIRGCHLIPAFSEGRTSLLLPFTQSDARMLESDTNDDWTNFYVGM